MSEDQIVRTIEEAVGGVTGDFLSHYWQKGRWREEVQQWASDVPPNRFNNRGEVVDCFLHDLCEMANYAADEFASSADHPAERVHQMRLMVRDTAAVWLRVRPHPALAYLAPVYAEPFADAPVL
jgi:hypothetical protein